jgi:hypothetical protein
MINKTAIERIIRLTRPKGKFLIVSHSDEFIEKGTLLGKSFYYVSLYDEKIDSNIVKTPHGLILINNTYLPSFAYNLFLCFLYHSDRSKNGTGSTADKAYLLKHNFKKFFAEQLLHFHNNTFSRAIFLETLLYEQQHMVPVFAAREQNSDLDEKATFAAGLMSNLVSFHELGHFYLAETDKMWEELVVHNSSTLKVLYEKIEHQYSEAFLEEFKCDAISIFSCVNEHNPKVSYPFLLNAVTFGYSAFAVMVSLVKSAHKTASEHRKTKEVIDLQSIDKIKRDFDFTLGLDTDFIERAKLVTDLCQLLAKEKGFDLFEPHQDFHFSASILNDLLAYVDSIMESDDDNARKMSMLVAESLYKHPDGMDYLYLRSKVFTAQRVLIL